MKVYHGTSADNLQSILANGFDGHRGQQVWTCSSGYNYFWHPAALKKSNGFETMEEARKEAFRQAKESAEMSLAKANDCRRVVFEVDIPKEELTRDTSCPNMDGAVMATCPVPPEWITAIWIDSESLSLFKGYFIACGMERELRCPMDLTPVERTVGKIFAKSGESLCHLSEALSDMELEEFPFDKKK